MALEVWNNLDEIAILIGIERLEFETDDDFYKRIRAIAQWKYKTDYETEVHTIPLQSGLDTKIVAEIIPLSQEYTFKCSIDWEYFIFEETTKSIAEEEREFFRVFIGTPNAKLKSIKDVFDNSTRFSFIYKTLKAPDYNMRTIIRKTNYFIFTEKINNKSYNLMKNNVVGDSLKCNDESIIAIRKFELGDLNTDGDYFIDEESGYLEIFSDILNTIQVSYNYTDQIFFFEATDINLIPVNVISQYGITDHLIEIIPEILNGQVWGR